MVSDWQLARSTARRRFFAGPTTAPLRHGAAMNELRLSLSLGFLGLALVACSQPVERPAPGDAGPAVEDLSPARLRIVGSVVDLERRAVSGARVRLCGDPCRELSTSSAGAFDIRDVPLGSYGLHVELPGAGAADYGKVVIPLYSVEPAPMGVMTVAPIVLPRLGAAVGLGAGVQTVAIDATLSLTVDAGALGFPTGSGPPRLAGLRVPMSLFPDFCLPSGDGRVLAEWAFGPFNTTSSAPVEVHIKTADLGSPGLRPGMTVNLMTIDPDLGKPERQGVGKVSADGATIDSEPMTGIRRLTWLIVTMPGGGP